MPIHLQQFMVAMGFAEGLNPSLRTDVHSEQDYGPSLVQIQFSKN
jgi:hypothetical protein